MTATDTEDYERRDFLLDMLPRDSVGVEIGVHLGDFSQRILDAIAPRRLHLVDPWKHEASETYRSAWYGGKVADGQLGMDARYLGVCARFEAQIQERRVVLHRGDSAEAMAKFDDDSLDWVYVDGNHLYDYVKIDLALSLRKVRAGGYITGDDYSDGGWWDGGAKRAVDEFAQSDAVQLVEIRNEQFIFRKL